MPDLRWKVKRVTFLRGKAGLNKGKSMRKESRLFFNRV
jgi:hypothetical protein